MRSDYLFAFASRARGWVIVGTHHLVSRRSTEPLPSVASYGIASERVSPFHAILLRLPLMNRIAGFENSELMLDDGEAGLRHRRLFVKTASLGTDVAIDVPVVFVSAIQPLFGAVRSVAQLAHFGERLNLLTENVRKFVAIHKAAFRRLRPNLACHRTYPCMDWWSRTRTRAPLAVS